MRHTFLQVLTLFSVLCCLSSVAWSQTAPAVHGQGTPNVLPKFTGANSIGNTAIFERDGCISETPNFVTTVAGILCLHDLGGGATVHVATNLTDRVAFIAENDVEIGNPVGIEGFIASRDGGVGVLGVSANSLGNGFGVFGDSESPQGIGVLGRNNATSGDPVGVLGATASHERGIGVRGRAESQDGNGIGVLGEVESPDGVAVVGNGFRVGVQGIARATSGFTEPISGITFSPDGAAAVFRNPAGGSVIVGQGLNNAQTFRVDANGTVFANGGFQAGGADFAESMAVAGDASMYQPGDLLVIDVSSKRRLKLANTAYSTLVAGVYSTKPGLIATPHKMNDPALAKEVPMAVVGIVPVKVSVENGAIQVGDLLVSSSTPGHAMRGTDRSRMLGAVIGKALEPLREGNGVVQVLVTLQ
jgi:hypothetical protein